MRSTRLRHRLVLSTALGTGLLLAAPRAGAQDTARLPTAADVVTSAGIGTPVLSVGDTRLDVGVTSNGATVDWKQFDIPVGQSIHFNDETGGGGTPVAVLNRVIGDGGIIKASTIDGLLQAPSNMAVFLINSAGITFGPTGAVNVGSLIASTLDLQPETFLTQVEAGRYTFAGTGTGGVQVDAGARLFASGSSAAGLGNLVLLGAKVAVGPVAAGTTATILARSGIDPDAPTVVAPSADDGDVALVAADDVTVGMAAGSPLSITIAKGTAVEGAFKVDGSIAGRNVTLALATRGGVTDTLLSVAGMTTATGVAVTDHGVVLTAGRDVAGVTLSPALPLADPADIDPVGAIATTATIGSGRALAVAAVGAATLGGGITTGGDLVVNAAGITLGTATTTVSQAATGKVDLTARTGDIRSLGTLRLGANRGDVAYDPATPVDRGLYLDATGGAIDLTGSSLTTGSTPATGYAVQIRNDADNPTSIRGVTLGDITAHGLTVADASHTLSRDTAIDVTGGLTLGTARLTAATITATGNIAAASLNVDAAASLDSSAGGVTLGGLTTLAGNAILTASGTATVTGAVDIAGNYAVTGGSVSLGTAGTATTQAASGTVTITATGGTLSGLAGLTLQSGVAGTLTLATTGSTGGDIAFAGTTLVAGDTTDRPAVQIRSRGGDNTVTLGTVRAGSLLGAVADNSFATGIVRNAAITVGDVTLAGAPTGADTTLRLDAGTAALTTGTLIAPTITLGAGELSLGGITGTGAVTLTGSGALTAGSIAGITGLTIDRGGSITLSDVTASGDILIGQTATARPATITTTGPLTSSTGAIRLASSGAQALGTLVATGTVTLTGTGLSATALTAGNLTGISTGSDAVTIGAITTTVGDAAITGAAAVSIDGAVSVAGAYAVTGGSVTLGTAGVATTQAAGGTVSIEATDGDVTGRSSLILRSDRDGAGNTPLTIATSRAGGGTIDFTGATLQGGSLRQSAVRIAPGSAANIVTLGNVTASALQGDIIGGGAYADRITRATTLTFGTVDLTNALVATSTTGDIRLGGATIGAGQGITLSAANALLLPTTLSAPGAITLTTGADLTTGSVESTASTLSITTNGNALAATSLTGATGLTIDAGAGAVTLGSGSGGNGALSITAGTLNPGGGRTSLSAVGALTLALSGAARFDTLTGGSIDVTGNSIDLVTAITPGDIVLNATGTLAIGTVTAGTVSAGTGTATLIAGDALTGTRASGVGGVGAQGRSADVGSLAASNGAASLITTGGTARLGTATALTSVTVGATGGAAIVTDAATAGGSYTVSGTGVTLGNGIVPVVQSARGAVTVTASNGTLAAGSGLTLRANADASGAEALTLVTDGSTGGDIAFAGGLQAGPAITAGSSLTVRSRSSTNAVTLGDIVAQRLTGAAGGTPDETGLRRSGAIRTGAVTLGQSLVLNGGSTVDLGTVSASVIDLSAQGALTATSLTATGGAIILSGTGIGATTTTGNITTTGAASDIRIDRSGAARFGSLLATQDLRIGSATTLDVTGTTGAGRDIAISGTGAQTYAGMVTAGILTTGGSGSLTGGTLTLNGGVTAATGAVSLTANAGDLRVSTVNAGSNAILTASGTATVTGAVDIAGNYAVTGGSVSLGTAGTATTQAASGTVTITATGGTLSGLAGLTLQSGVAGTLTLATTGSTGGDIAFAGTTLVAGDTTDRPAVQIRSRGGDNTVTLGTVRAGSLLGAVADNSFATGIVRNAAITVGDVTLAGAPTCADTTLRLDACTAALTTGTLIAPTITLGAGELSLGGITGTGAVTLTGSGALTAGSIAGITGLTIDRGGSITLSDVTASGDILIGQTATARPATITTTGPLTSSTGAIRLASSGAQALGGTIGARGAAILDGGSIVAGTVTSTTAMVQASATGAITLASATSAGDTMVDAGGIARITGAVSSGAGYRVTGSGVVLGNGTTPVTQAANGSVRLISTAGTIAGSAGLTLQGDRAATGIGTLVLDGAGGIALDPATVLRGGTGTTGDIGVRTGTGAGIALGIVAARRLTGADAASALTATLAASGTLDLAGTVTTVRTLEASAAGTLTTRAITVTGANQDLILTTTGTTADITARGLLTAPRDLRLTAARNLDFTTAIAGTTATATATTGTLTGTTLTGGTTAGALAGGALSLTTLTGQSGALARGTAITLGSAETITGPLSLIATTGDLIATRAVSGGAVTLSAGGSIALGLGQAGGDLTIVDALGVGGIGGTRTALSAGRDLTVTARGAVRGTTFTAASNLAVTAGSIDLLTGTAIGGSARLTTTGDTVLGQVDTAGNLTIDVQGALRATSLTAAGTIAARGASATIGRTTANTVALTATTGDLTLTEVTGAAGVSLIAAGDTHAGNVTATGATADLSIATRNLDGGIGVRSILTAGRDLTLTARGTVLAGPVDVGRQATLRAASLDLSTLTAAGAAITASAGDAVAGSLTTTGALDYTASGIARIGTIGAGRVATITGGIVDLSTLTAAAASITATAGDAVAGSLTTVGTLDYTASGIARVGTIDAGGFATITGGAVDLGTVRGRDGVRASSLNTTLKIVDLSTSGNVVLGAATDADLGLIASTAGTLDITAGGALRATSLTAAGPITAQGASAAIGRTTGGGTVALTTTTGDLTLTEVTGAAGVSLIAAGDIHAGNVTATGATADLSIATRNLDGGTGVRSILTAGRDLTLTARGTVLAGPVVAGRQATLRAASLDLSTLTAAGASITATAGDAVAGSLTTTGTLDYTASGIARVGTINAGGFATITGGAVDLGTVRGRDGVRATSLDTTLKIVDLSTSRDVVLGAATDADLGRIVSTSGSLGITAGGVLGASTLTAATAITGAGATVTIGTATATDIALTARNGALAIGTVTAANTATLIQRGTGELSVTGTVTTGGDAVLTGDGALTAPGIVAGRDLRLATGTTLSAPLLTAGRDLRVTAGDAARLAVLTAGRAIEVTAAGAATVTGAVTAGSYAVQGGTITLGTAGTAVTQQASNAVTLRATQGKITGLQGLTLLADNDGNGAGDLTLRAATGIGFATGTSLLAGRDASTAIRLAPSTGAPLALDIVRARTLLSDETGATRFAHDGAVTIADLLVRDATTISLSGGVTPLTLGTVNALGSLTLTTTGALTADTLIVADALVARGGRVAFTGTDVGRADIASTAGPLDLTRLTARGAATLDAASTLGFGTITAGGALTLGATGDILGRDAATLTSTAGAVTAATRETGDAGGTIRLAAITAATDLAVTGRQIALTTATATGGSATLTARGNGATATALTVDRVEAGRAILLSASRGSGAPASPSNGTIRLGRANARGGTLGLSADGDLAALGDTTGTALTATGTVTAAIGRTALIDTAQAGGDLTIDAGELRLGVATATGTARATAGTTATIGSITARAIDLATRTGLLDVTTARATDALTLASGADLRLADGVAGEATTLTATGTARVTQMQAREVTITGNALLLDRITTTAGLTASAGSGGGTFGTIAAGTNATFASDTATTIAAVRTGAALTVTNGTGMLTIGQADIGTTARITTAGDSRIDTLTAGQDVTFIGQRDAGFGTLASTGGAASLTTAGALTAIGLSTAGALTVAARTVAITSGAAGTTFGATGNDLTLGTFTAGDTATVTAGTTATIGSITARAINLATRTGLLDVTTARATDALTLTSGADLRLADGVAGGAAMLTATGTARVTQMQAREATITGNALLLDRITTAGSLTANAGAGGLTLGTVATGTTATFNSNGALTIGSVTADGAIVAKAAGLLDATSLASRLATDLTAQGTTIGTVRAGTALAVTNGTGALTIGQATAGTTARFTTTGDSRIDTLTAGQDVTFTGQRDAGFGTLTSTAGAASLTTAGTLTATGLSTVRALTLTARTVAVTTATAGGDVTAATTGGDLTLDRVTTAGALTGTATGQLRATSLAATLGTTLTAQGMTIGTIRAGTALAVTNGTGTLAIGQATAGTTARITTTGDARIDTLTAGQDVSFTGQRDAGFGTLASTGGAASLTTAGALTATGLSTARALAVTARTATIGGATAGGDVTATATAGDLSLATLTAATGTMTASGTASIGGAVNVAGNLAVRAGGAITLGTAGATVAQRAGGIALTATGGAITGRGALTLSAGSGGMALTATGTGGAIDLATASALDSGAGLVLETAGIATLGNVTNTGRAITVRAGDIAMNGPITAGTITLTNRTPATLTRLGDAPSDNAAEFGAATTPRFDLSTAEIGRLASGQVILDAQTGAVTIGDLSLGTGTGSTLFQIRTSGRMDMLGRFVATGSPITRTIVLGGGADINARASVLRVAATSAGGGRLLVDGGTLDLRANAIGVGLDTGFLDAIGVKGTTPALDVATRYVAQASSALYNATLGNPLGLYGDPVTVQAGRMIVRYGGFALFQNTGHSGTTGGVVLGRDGQGQTLELYAAAPANAVALFGSVNGIAGTATSLLGGSTLVLGEQVSRADSRANGCLIGSVGGGCLSASLAQPTLNIFDSSRLDVFRTSEDLTLPFDPLISTSNEALFSDIAELGVEIGADIGLLKPKAPCPPDDKTCSTTGQR